MKCVFDEILRSVYVSRIYLFCQQCYNCKQFSFFTVYYLPNGRCVSAVNEQHDQCGVPFRKTHFKMYVNSIFIRQQVLQKLLGTKCQTTSHHIPDVLKTSNCRIVLRRVCCRIQATFAIQKM